MNVLQICKTNVWGVNQLLSPDEDLHQLNYEVRTNLRESSKTTTVSKNKADKEQSAQYLSSSQVNMGLQESSTDVIINLLAFSQ